MNNSGFTDVEMKQRGSSPSEGRHTSKHASFSCHDDNDKEEGNTLLDDEEGVEEDEEREDNLKLSVIKSNLEESSNSKRICDKDIQEDISRNKHTKPTNEEVICDEQDSIINNSETVNPFAVKFECPKCRLVCLLLVFVVVM